MNTRIGSPLICVGLGGICEGYLPRVLLFHQTYVLRFVRILLVDGQVFRVHNRTRQHFREGARPKAAERRDLWGSLYPKAPLQHLTKYVDSSNVHAIVPDGACVLLSPDNQATRKVVSDHAETLDNILLISGENDGIRREEGREGIEGSVIVHWKVHGRDETPPITRYHPEIAEPADRLPSEKGCLEQAQAGEPQLLATNLQVGEAMAALLHRYLTGNPEEAVRVVEISINVRECAWVPYGLAERPL